MFDVSRLKRNVLLTAAAGGTGLILAGSPAYAFDVDGIIGGSDSYSVLIPLAVTIEGGTFFNLPDLAELRIGRDTATSNILLFIDIDKNLDDNSYGAGSIGWNSPDDGGPKNHELYLGGGGENLEGSDKLELNVLGKAVTIDYIKDMSSDTPVPTDFAIVVEKDDGNNVVDAATSIEYNLNNPTIAAGATSASLDITLSSPIPTTSAASDGSNIVQRYQDIANLANGLENWKYNITYELELKGGGFANGNSVADLVAIATQILNVVPVVHLSPNKSDKNKV